MSIVEIRRAKNGWLVFENGRDMMTLQEPIVFTDWSKLSKYLRKRLAPEMRDVE